MKDKQTDTLDLNRRTLLKNATLLIPSALVAGNLAQAEDPAKPTESKKDVGSSKGSETKSEPVAVSPNDLEIDRRLARITAEFGQHLSPEQTKAVRDEVSVNFFRAKRLRAVPLNDFDDPITTFQPFCQELPGKHEIRSESTVIVSKQIILSDDSAFAGTHRFRFREDTGQLLAADHCDSRGARCKHRRHLAAYAIRRQESHARKARGRSVAHAQTARLLVLIVRRYPIWRRFHADRILFRATSTHSQADNGRGPKSSRQASRRHP